MCSHKSIGFGEGLITLRQMNVHLVSIEICIVSAAVCIVHSDGLLFGKDSASVGHDTGLMESWLSVNKERVVVGEMSVNDLSSDVKHLGEAVSLLR